jgi:putative transcriptional regulator
MSAIAPHQINPSELPSLPLEQFKQLPNKSVVYLVLTSDRKILYIGYSKNLRTRWMKHHLKKRLEQMNGVQIAWLELADLSELAATEFAFIKHFSPPFNLKVLPPKPKGTLKYDKDKPTRVLRCRLSVLMADRKTPLTQKQLASLTGLSPTTINQLYQNKFTRIDKDTVEKLCDYFDCQVADLFYFKSTHK